MNNIVSYNVAVRSKKKLNTSAPLSLISKGTRNLQDIRSENLQDMRSKNKIK